MTPIAFLPRDVAPAPLPDWVLSQLIDLKEIEEISHTPDPVNSQILGHREYRKKGPFLRILKDASLRVGVSEFRSYIHTRDLSVDMRGVDDFQPPSAEEMGTMIAQHSDVILQGFRLKHQSHGGYLYHRLPNEVYTFVYSGNLYASGNTYRATPNPPGTSF